MKNVIKIIKNYQIKMAAIFFFWEPLIVTKIRKVIGASWTDGKLFASERALYFQDYNFFTASGWKFAKELSSKLDGWKLFPGKWFLVQTRKETMFWHEWKILEKLAFYFTRVIWKIQPSHLNQAFLPIKTVKTTR